MGHLPSRVGYQPTLAIELSELEERICSTAGWSIAVPTLIGIAIGLWIDHHWPSGYSWTFMLMLAGVALGAS